MDKSNARTLFDQYFAQRLASAGAVLPDERLHVLNSLEQELLEAGRLPIAPGEVATFNPAHPTYAAILRGDAVNISGQSLGTTTTRTLSNLPLAARLGLVVGSFLIPVLLMGSLLLMRQRGRDVDEPQPVAASVITPTATVTAEPTPTLAPGATPQPTATPEPTITPTPLPVTNLRGEAADRGSEPASIDIAGEAFLLSVGRPENGLWHPNGAEWLAGSTVRRVIAVPRTDALDARLNGVTAEEVSLALRLRSGTVVHYVTRSLGQTRRDHIELLAADTPSIIVILYDDDRRGDDTHSRLVIIGEARQALPANASQPSTQQSANR